MKIMVLPGTVWQVPLMRRIKALGHELYLVNPVRIEGVTELADHFVMSDIFAENEVIDYCKQECIDVVMSDECDIATDVLARYNKAIGANGLSEEMASLFTSKYRMREFCSKNNISPILYKRCKSADEALEFYRNSGMKLIMKPIDSNSSHGVVTICSERDIVDKFNETLTFSRNEKTALLEEYIEGTEFTADGLMTDTGHITLAVSEKTHYKHNENIANSLFFTQTSPIYDYSLLRETNDKLLNATGLPFGLTHVEYKYMNGKYYLIEMAARGGGNLISAIIAPFMSGIDSYEYLISRTLDDKYELDTALDVDNDKTSILKFLEFPFKSGIIKAIHGEECLSEDPRIRSYMLNIREGDCLHQPESDTARLGYYIICANSRKEFNEVTRKIKANFKIEIQKE